MTVALLVVATAMLPAEFPEPEGLAPNVRLWERVYSEWTSAQVVFHDRAHMGVVYGVLELGELRLFPRPENPEVRRQQVRDRRALIEARQAEILAGLRRLAALQRQADFDPDALEGELAILYAAIAEGGGLDDLAGAAERIRWQYGLADRFFEGLGRYDQYRHVVSDAFVSRGLPEDLLALAFVESLFDPTAVSHAGAAGMFQFMPATGREYGLARGPLWDLRRDPALAAEAAARMLRRNYQRLGNWPLALTGYNHGPNGVARGVRQVESNDLMDLIDRYQSPSWGFASRNFYAQFLAARRVLANRHAHFGDWVPLPPKALTEVRLTAPASVAALTRRDCIDRETLAEYNPALLPAAFAGSQTLPRGFALRVPEGAVAEHFVTCAGAIGRPQADDPTLVATSRDYRVRQGDTLTHIARRHGVSVDDIIEANELSPDGFIRTGQVLRIPGRGPGVRGAGGVGLARPEP
jgi:membrane-bound lytic murein transglycosylase D